MAPPGTLRLDARDLRMLCILQTEGRLSKAALAERVNLSPTPCWQRLRRLEQAGLIEGYEARIGLRALADLTEVLTSVELDSHRAHDFERFERALDGIPEVVECWALGGGIDYLLRFVVPGINEYQRLVDGMLGADIGLKRYWTYVVTRRVKRAAVPLEHLLGRA